VIQYEFYVSDVELECAMMNEFSSLAERGKTRVRACGESDRSFSINVTK